MGSLVPGWDTDIGVPKDLAPDSDIDKEPEPEGYFARLRSHRHGTEGSGGHVATRSLARVSAPQPLARSVTSKRDQQQQAPAFQRSSTQSHGAGGGAGGPHRYQLTDWSDELTTLRKQGLARSSVGAYGYDHEHGHGAAWWRALEVGHLNEHPDPDAAKNFVHDTQRSTFVPQFTQSSKLDFGERQASAGGGGGNNK